jgi:hypothetical protein
MTLENNGFEDSEWMEELYKISSLESTEKQKLDSTKQFFKKCLIQKNYLHKNATEFRQTMWTLMMEVGPIKEKEYEELGKKNKKFTKVLQGATDEFETIDHDVSRAIKQVKKIFHKIPSNTSLKFLNHLCINS